MTQEIVKMGRPLKFKNVKQLEKQIESYFTDCFEKTLIKKAKKKTKKKKAIKAVYEMRQMRPFTITGLAVALDTSRQTLVNYEGNEDFFDTIKKAKDIIENWTEEQLYRSTQVTGVIFNLKNNYGWKDVQEIESTTKNVNFNINLDAKTSKQIKELTQALKDKI